MSLFTKFSIQMDEMSHAVIINAHTMNVLTKKLYFFKNFKITIFQLSIPLKLMISTSIMICCPLLKVQYADKANV